MDSARVFQIMIEAFFDGITDAGLFANREALVNRSRHLSTNPSTIRALAIRRLFLGLGSLVVYPDRTLFSG
jgi:hypothetical protein